jgi:prefoldin subunit 2
VAETIRPLESSRKCFQLIGGVLAERTVGEVLPLVETNRDSVRAGMHDAHARGLCR